MPTFTETGDKQGVDSGHAVATTTLNVIFNGTMVMLFEEQEIIVIAPNIPHSHGGNPHRYEINHVNFKANQRVNIAMSDGAAHPTHWEDILDRRQVLMRDQSQIGGVMPRPGLQDAVIKLPYPEHIYPLRVLDMAFDDPSGNGQYAGALVFSYTNVNENSINVSGVNNCQARKPMANYSELYVLASITPHTPDPGDDHSIMSWKAVANLTKSAWNWKSGDDTRPQPRRVPGMDCDVDDPNYPITRVRFEPFGGGNCKVPIAIVTYNPLLSNV